MNKQIELVTVTYNKDFNLIKGLLETINHYIDEEFHHTIILNDDFVYMSELTDICNQFPRINRTIIHCDKIESYRDHKIKYEQFDDVKRRQPYYMVGWILAQVIIFYFAEISRAEYYIILTSRNRIKKYWNLNTIIKEGKSPLAINDKWKNIVPQFQDFFKSSFNMFDLDWENKKLYENIPDSNTPYIWNTAYVLDILNYFSNKNSIIFDYILGPNGSCDSYIYYAWLIYKNLSNTIYPTKFHKLIHEVR